MSESEDAPLANVTQLISSITDVGIYTQFREQLQKDIHRAGLDYELQPTAVPYELVQECIAMIQDLLSCRFNDLLNLLYAVDISENEVRKIIRESSVDMANEITLSILKREYQKVKFRNQK